jgi:hypothetical protein
VTPAPSSQWRHSRQRLRTPNFSFILRLMPKKGTSAKAPASTVSTPPIQPGTSDAPAARGRPSALLDTRVVYCGDCLEQLRSLPDACVDLVYIDPPFNSNRNFEVFWGETKDGSGPSRTATPPRRRTSTTCTAAASSWPVRKLQRFSNCG